MAALDSFDLVQSVAIDYMHCLLEGVVKKLLSLWFDFSAELYCISKFTDVVDQRLKEIKPPEIVTRLPNSIAKRCYWKGSSYVVH